MKNILFIALVFCATYFAQAQAFFSNADAFLKQNVRNGLVNYDGIKANSEPLQKLVGEIANFPLSEANQNTQLAFYLNAYNILAIQNVLNNYPVASPLDIEGFFDKITFSVAGKNLTLNQIENDIIRPQFGDARIHFALVCVAKGCPQIAAEAFTGEQVQVQLEKLTQKAMNDANFIRVNIEEKTVLASEIFKWYAVDFGTNQTAVLEYINKYSVQELSGFTLDYYAYNWKLNKL